MPARLLLRVAAAWSTHHTPRVRAPVCRYLLAATDGPRVLMLRVADCSAVRTMFGLPEDKFHSPSLAWHKDGRHVYVGAAHAVVLVVHMGGWRSREGCWACQAWWQATLSCCM